VRQEGGSFWAPFAGAAAGIMGQAIGNALFRPQYYVPPVYQPGASVLRGFGMVVPITKPVDRYRAVTTLHQRQLEIDRICVLQVGLERPHRSVNHQYLPDTNTGNRATGSGWLSTLRQSGRSNSSIRRRSSNGFGGSRSFGSGSRSWLR